MPRCFVMQPFDPEFDRRYRELFAPAIAAAGCEPYRVDGDPDAGQPVDILQEITQADVCLADVTRDNPNVWFELGFAVARRKPLCIVCSGRRADCPFDVRQFEVLEYDDSSAAGLDRARREIQRRVADCLAGSSAA